MERALPWFAILTASALIGCATADTDASDDDDDHGPADAGGPWWDQPDGGGPPPPPPPGDADAAPVTGGPPAECTGPIGGAGGFQVIECVPAAAVEPAALVVALHGYTHDPARMLAATEWDVLAGRYGFYVVFVRSSPDFRSWYWYTTGRSRGQADPAGIVAIVDDMTARYPIDPARVFVSGMSSGGYMTVNLLADYPEVFAAGSSVSGGPHGCGVLCPHSDTAGAAFGGGLIRAEHPAVWDDTTARKPRLITFHGDLDETNVPANSDHLHAQWLDAHGADATPDNAALGLPAELSGYPYEVYERGGEIVLAHVRMTDLGHGIPVNPGDGVDQGGYDEIPSKTADPCGVCPQDWTNTGSIYGPYYEAEFFGLIP